MSGLAIARLSLADAHDLAPLLSAYAQARKRGAPRAPDEFYAERLVNDPVAAVLGARDGERLVGFAVFAELPEPLTGLRIGQLSDLFVIQDAQGQGIGRALVSAIAEEGRKRGWGELRWLVPDKAEAARLLADRLARPGRSSAYVVDL
jgi:GNAT superfamily N-acetyltransferase